MEPRPGGSGKTVQNSNMRSVAFTVLIWCSFFCLQARTAQQFQLSPGFHFEKKEVALGAQLAVQVRRETTPLGLVVVDRYVGKFGRDLARHMPNAPEEWHFSVIKDREDSSTYEPISLPGGWIFIPAQLILASKNEGEFAGMLAHAMAHVALRHGVRRQPPGEVTYMATIPLVLIGPATFGQDDRNSVAPIAYLKIQRNYELEADKTAVETIAAADFDPNDLVNYIARVQPVHTTLSEAASPMPSAAVRISSLKRAIQNLSPTGRRRSPDSFQRIQDEVPLAR